MMLLSKARLKVMLPHQSRIKKLKLQKKPVQRMIKFKMLKKIKPMLLQLLKHLIKLKMLNLLKMNPKMNPKMNLKMNPRLSPKMSQRKM
ncbi:MAG: hypothetical protein COA94_08605 [Rickettsiales bacterium]|nr:MAG: hypothetical protein COA94_08605 [Rickettsiales bacterium]